MKFYLVYRIIKICKHKTSRIPPYILTIDLWFDTLCFFQMQSDFADFISRNIILSLYISNFVDRLSSTCVNKTIKLFYRIDISKQHARISVSQCIHILLSLSLYLSIYIYIYIYMYSSDNLIIMNDSLRANTCVYTHTQTHTHVWFVCAHIYTANTHFYFLTHLLLHTHTHKHTHIYIYIYIYIYPSYGKILSSHTDEFW